MTSRPLRVEVVVPVGGMGGAERLALSVLDHEADRLAVTVLGLGESPFVDAARERGWPVHVLPTGRRSFDIAAAAAAAAVRWRRSDVEVVWANGVKAAAVAVPASRLVGVPVVWAKHDFSYDAHLARPLARRCAAVIAPGRLVAGATGRTDVVLLPPPRPPQPTAPPPRLVDGPGLVVACVGRLAGYKGVDDVVAALALPQAAAWHVAVVGDDDPTEPGEQDRLQRLAKELGVEARVHFLGAVADAGRLLGGVDVVAVPTKVDLRGKGREGWSLVADEAMAAGVPLVAARGGAVTERLGAAGVAVDQDAPDQIADALARLADPGVRRAMGEHGRSMVAAQPAPEEYAGMFASVLATAARRPGAGLVPDRPVSLVVPFHQEGAAAVRQSFADLTEQIRPGDELVVVDDGSRDETPDELARWAANTPGARVVRLPVNGGPAAARNAGVRAASEAVVACTDAGCRPGPGWLDALRVAFQERRPPALLTGVYEVAARTPAEQAAALACYPVVDEARRAGPLVRGYAALFGRSFDPSASNGRSMAFTRQAWEAVGGFPEHLRTAEDVAFGVAVAGTGGRCELSVDAAVVWSQRTDLRATARMYLRYGEGDGASRHRRMVARDLARLAAYGLAPVVVWRGGRRARSAVGLGAAAYLSLPVARVVRRGASPAVLAWVPVVMAVKDVAKAVGCVRGLLLHSKP